MKRNFRYLSKAMALLHIKQRITEAKADKELMVLTIIKSDYWDDMKEFLKDEKLQYARYRFLDKDGVWGVKIWGWA